MSKTIRVTAVVAVIIEGLYLIIGRFAVPILVYYTSSPRLFIMGSNTNADETGILVYMLYALVTGVGSILLQLLFMILLINAANSRNESIVMEVLGIILCSFLPSVTGTILSVVMNLIVTRMLSNQLAITEYSLMQNGASFAGFVHLASLILLIISFACSICRKKYVLPLEYEKGIGVEDEYGNLINN